jgi:hypothetical protein
LGKIDHFNCADSDCINQLGKNHFKTIIIIMAKRKNEISSVNGLDKLAVAISQTNEYFLNQLKRQVNTTLTLRNWVIGFYIVEYEQEGKDRAIYGQKLFKEIADRLKAKGVKSIRDRHLYLCKDLYNTYPEILRTLSAE